MVLVLEERPLNAEDHLNATVLTDSANLWQKHDILCTLWQVPAGHSYESSFTQFFQIVDGVSCETHTRKIVNIKRFATFSAYSQANSHF